MLSYRSCDESPAVVSSIAVFIFASLLSFIIGFLSGYFTLRFRYKHASSAANQQSDGQARDQPLYEAIPGVECQNLELEENTAYSAANSNDQQGLQMAINLAYTQVQLGDEDQNLKLTSNIAYMNQCMLLAYKMINYTCVQHLPMGHYLSLLSCHIFIVCACIFYSDAYYCCVVVLYTTNINNYLQTSCTLLKLHEGSREVA